MSRLNLSRLNLSQTVLALLLVSAASGCPGKQDRIADARALMATGEVIQACDLLEGQLATGSKKARITATRLLVDCSARAGDPERAARHIATTRDPGIKLYGQAMLALARSPANLERSVGLLGQAAEALPGQSEPIYRAGLLWLLDGQAARARPLLERACKLDSSAMCSLTLAHTMLDLGQPREALQRARAASGLEPTPKEIARGRALVRRVQRRTRAVPQAARARFQRAMRLLHDEDKGSECLRLVEELVLEFPRFAGAHTLVGLAQLRLANPAEAVVALRRAAALNPLDATNAFYLALIYQQRQRWDDTARSLEQALKLDPFHLRALKLLGEVRLRTGQSRAAAEALDLLVTLQPAVELNLRLSARAHLAAGNQARAEARYGELQKEREEDFESNLRLGQILLARHRAARSAGSDLLARAREHAARAAKVRPDDMELTRLQADLGLE